VTSGNVTDEIMMESISNLEKDKRKDDDFTIQE